MIIPAIVAAAIVSQPSPFQLQIFLVGVVAIFFCARRTFVAGTLPLPVLALCVYISVCAIARATILPGPVEAAILTLRQTALLLLCVALALQVRPSAIPRELLGIVICCAAAFSAFGYTPIYNPSINGAILASLVPFSGGLITVTATFVSVSAIFSHSTTTIAALVITLLLMTRYWVYLVPLAICGCFLWNAPNLNQSERFEMYRATAQFLRMEGPWSILFGTGYGSFHFYGPIIRAFNGLPNSLFFGAPL